MSLPHLLYVYPWMPYPRRVIIYLREHNVPASLVTIVPVSDPGDGDKAAEGFPPRPEGSLPILAIPPQDAAGDRLVESLEGWRLLRQSLSILTYLSKTAVKDSEDESVDAYVEACNLGYEVSAETVMTAWNTVRVFGTGVGVIEISEAAKESLKWVHRKLAVIERHLDQENGVDAYQGGYAERLSLEDDNTKPSAGDILLMSFLERMDDLYCCFDELTLGKGEEKDAYGRETQNAGYDPHIRKFYGLFQERPSASRKTGQGYSEQVKPNLGGKAAQ